MIKKVFRKKRIKVCFFSILTIYFFIGMLFAYQKLSQNEKTNNFKNSEFTMAIYLEDTKTNTIPSKESGYYFDREKSSCTNGANMEWDSVTWSPRVENLNTSRTSCKIHFAKKYTEGILNGTDPVLKDELIPVTIEENGTVRKADLTKPWYNYASKNWANTVITRNSYDVLNANGKVNGASKKDGYVLLDGVDDYIDLELANYDFKNTITYVANFSINNYTDGYQIISNMAESGFALGATETCLYLTDAYQCFSYRDKNELNKRLIVAVTYDGKVAKVYLNGKLQNTLNYEGVLKTSPMPILIGANPELNGNHKEFTNMSVYQVALYDRVLSEEEIKNNFSNDIKIKNNDGLLKYVDFTDKQDYEVEEIIPEEIIESYFTWIPKYRYQLWDLGEYEGLTTIDTNKAHTIPVVFGDYNTSDSKSGECTTPMTSGASGNCKVGDYMTHPAFLSIPSKGFWVGKFETGYLGSANTAEAEQNIVDTSKIEIKPNVYSWRGIQVSTAHLNSYNYKRNLDSHMMKNTEWGAVAYLQHSKYGSSTSVRVNNNSNQKTGYAAKKEPTCGYTETNEECNKYGTTSDITLPYNTPTGYLASTTGNISGIYDMSGGSWEYMMAVVEGPDGPYIGKSSSQTQNSGFKGILYGTNQINDGVELPDNSYYDIYQYVASENYIYSIRILGDATGEMGPFEKVNYILERPCESWYHNLGFPFTGSVYYKWYFWHIRGDLYSSGTESGVFSFSGNIGQATTNTTYRIILTP